MIFYGKPKGPLRGPWEALFLRECTKYIYKKGLFSKGLFWGSHEIPASQRPSVSEGGQQKKAEAPDPQRTSERAGGEEVQRTSRLLIGAKRLRVGFFWPPPPLCPPLKAIVGAIGDDDPAIVP